MPLRNIYLPARTDMGRLRVGLALQSLHQPRWIAQAIAAIRQCGAADLVTIIRLPSGQPSDGASCGAYRLYRYADAAYFSHDVPDGGALAPVDIAPHVEGARAIEVAIGASGHVTPDDFIRLQQEHLDVILFLPTSMPHGNLTEAAVYGVWRYCHGDGTHHAGGPTLFWELFDGCPMTGIRLLYFPPGGGRSGKVCSTSVSAPYLSVFLNRQKPLMAAAAFAARGLRALQRQGPAAVREWLEKTALEAPSAATRGQPGTIDVARLVVRIVIRWLRLRLANRHGDWWFLATRRRPATPLGEDSGDRPPEGFQPLPVPPGRFHADPFLFEQNGETHLFFEDFDVAGGRGAISHCRLDSEGKASALQVVLDRPYHLSYPFVFRWNGEVFMLPETSQNKTVELYRAESFPDSWVPDRVLLEGWHATDATLHCDDAGRWWLFATIDECGAGDCEELFLFQAETPLGPWRPHPGNPIVADVRCARPAGRLFYRDGTLIRPAQDCATHYGSGLWFMEVLELTPDRYRERALKRLGPEWLPDNHCLHHFDTTSKIEIIDGMRRRPSRHARALVDPRSPVQIEL